MPAFLTSLADATLTVSVKYTRYPQPSRVRDVTLRMWDGRTRPEVHRGPTRYTRWTWSPIWPGSLRHEAEALLSFFEALDLMGDARVRLWMPPVVGGHVPWEQTVELLSPEVVQDFASSPTATVIPLELVQVDDGTVHVPEGEGMSPLALGPKGLL